MRAQAVLRAPQVKSRDTCLQEDFILKRALPAECAAALLSWHCFGGRNVLSVLYETQFDAS